MNQPKPMPPETVPLKGAEPKYSAYAIALAFLAVTTVAVTPLAIVSEGVRLASVLPASSERPAVAAVALLVIPVMAVVLLLSALLPLPGAFARREVTVGPAGLEFTEHGLVWRPERRGFVPWEAVALAVDREVDVIWRRTPHARPALDLFLERPVHGLPGFAACRPADPDEASDPHGRPFTPAIVRILSPTPTSEESHRRIVQSVRAHRPDLFDPDPGVVVGPPKASHPMPGRLLVTGAAVSVMTVGAMATGLLVAFAGP